MDALPHIWQMPWGGTREIAADILCPVGIRALATGVQVGPSGPKLEKESENEFPWPLGPGNSFSDSFSNFGPEGPK